MPNKSFKEISHCKQCGTKNHQGRLANGMRKMFCPVCKPPRTGRVEKKGDREKLEKELKRINPIKQYLKEREREFEQRFVRTKAEIVGMKRLETKWLSGRDIDDVKSFHSETIKGLIQMLIEEDEKTRRIRGEKVHMWNITHDTPVEIGKYDENHKIIGYNQAKQESKDRLLELIK